MVKGAFSLAVGNPANASYLYQSVINGTYNNIYLPETSAETGRWQDTPDEGLQLPEVDTDTPAADTGRTLRKKQSLLHENIYRVMI